MIQRQTLLARFQVDREKLSPLEITAARMVENPAALADLF